MHRSETEDLIDCLVCGAEIALGVDRCFAVTEDTGLCFACAVARGGIYSEVHDTWTEPPDLNGLEPVARDA